MKLIFVRHADPCKENYSITDKGVITAHKLGAHLSKTKIDKIIKLAKLTTKIELRN